MSIPAPGTRSIAAIMSARVWFPWARSAATASSFDWPAASVELTTPANTTFVALPSSSGPITFAIWLTTVRTTTAPRR